jgi:hypothetical protein
MFNPSSVGAHPATSTTLKPFKSDYGEISGTPFFILVIRPAGLL